MPPAARFLNRLRQHALRWYEILLCAILIALALSIAAPAHEGEAEPAQCGNIQSSTAVMQR